MRACWCEGDLGKEIGRHYQICGEAGAAVLAVLPAAEDFKVSGGASVESFGSRNGD
jgi:hypothetical protein